MEHLVFASLVATLAVVSGDPVVPTEDRVLVSYAYYRPRELTTPPKRLWSKCAFEGQLCGCTTEIRMGSAETAPTVKPQALLTNCTARMCWCKGHGGRLARYEQCSRNFDLFLRAGIVAAPAHVDFRVNVIGSSETPPALAGLDLLQHRVEVVPVPLAPTDLCVQGDVARQFFGEQGDGKGPYRRFFFINCSARGPFAAAGESWLAKFEAALSEPGLHLAGPVINCWQRKPHVQSWAWFADGAAAALMAQHCRCNGTRNEQISACELGISGRLLAGGNGIASLQPSYAGLDWTDSRNANCNGGKSPVGCSKSDPAKSLACVGADPCAEVFVKYGGTNLDLGFISRPLHERVQRLDSADNVCPS
ncbi:hypothetical protein DIPPA_20800 [Diplonema papillatum]|nr:hypothetical protein DIPPA_20800 [Diplonema papillatum]